jgi:uncharacterized membrane protein YidH (DUF202 family)
MGGGKGTRRIVAGGVVGIALVAAVGLASRAHTPAGGGHTRSISQDILLEYALLAMAALALVVVPVSLYLFVVGREEMARSLPARKNWALKTFVAITALSAVAVILLAGGYLRRHGNPHDTPVVSQLAGLAKAGTQETRAVRFDWAPVIVVSTLVVLALAAGAWIVLQRRRGEARPERLSEEIAVALERTIADLRAEPDPRRAVIAAYAQMERALAEAGLPRTASEAPREYLGRVLPALGARVESVERLTALFERAKFSPHTIDAEMKDAAITALESLRDDLRSAS